MSSSPILLLGAASPVRGRIHEILVAAGYGVVIADSPAAAVRLAAAKRPRLVVAPVDAEEEWRTLLDAVGERFDQAMPVLTVSGDAVGPRALFPRPNPASCREPGFGRQLLEEIQYVERTFRPAPAGREERGSHIGTVPVSPRRAAT